jgi:hypothetical protein
MTGNERDVPYYGKARIRLAALLIATACLLAIIDALSAEYEVSIGVLGLLLGTAGVFLGVEALKRLAS